MDNNDFQKWLDNVTQRARSSKPLRDAPTPPCIRVSNDRFALHSTFEDRLTQDDKLLLQSMGIAL